MLFLFLPPFIFAVPFSAKKQACGPEARAFRGKSIGGKRIPTGDHPVPPQYEAGLSAPGRAPLQRNHLFLGGRRACPPGPRNDARLMIFARNALAFGPGNA